MIEKSNLGIKHPKIAHKLEKEVEQLKPKDLFIDNKLEHMKTSFDEMKEAMKS